MKMMWYAAALLALSGCGGGGNESGPADSIEVSMSTVTVSKGDGGCYVGNGPQVHVFGGTPPYRVSNPLPVGLSFSRSVVPASGDAFQINFVGGICMTSMVVTVEDDMGRLARVTVNNGSSSGG